jgi:hypothetical protein
MRARGVAFSFGWIGVVAAAVLGGCTVNSGPAVAPVIPTKQVTFKKPVFTPLPETKQSQEKGGITISVTPGNYSEVAETHKDDREVGRSVVRTYTLGGPATDTPVREIERTTTQSYRVSPDHVQFLVKISNHLPRVFRPAGAVVQFNVGGKLVSVEQSQYAELANLIVPPRNEAEVHIDGPALSGLGDKATVGLFLYDIITSTDAAGNATEKQNFEWYFNYSTETVTKEVQVRTEHLQERIGPSTPVPSQPRKHH